LAGLYVVPGRSLPAPPLRMMRGLPGPCEFAV
jgi:hypothetical protein